MTFHGRILDRRPSANCSEVIKCATYSDRKLTDEQLFFLPFFAEPSLSLTLRRINSAFLAPLHCFEG